MLLTIIVFTFKTSGYNVECDRLCSRSNRSLIKMWLVCSINMQLLYQPMWETLYVILYLPFFMKLSSLKMLIRSSLFLSLTHGLSLLSKISCNLKTSGWIFLISVWSHMMSENLRSIIYLRAVSVIVLPSTLLWVKKNLSPSLSLLNWSAENWSMKIYGLGTYTYELWSFVPFLFGSTQANGIS